MADETDTPADPTPPTHQDVVDALRTRIIYECGVRPTAVGDLAALVVAYTGTDARESEFLSENIRAVLDRMIHADPRPSSGEIRESILRAFSGKFDAMDWTGVDAMDWTGVDP